MWVVAWLLVVAVVVRVVWWEHEVVRRKMSVNSVVMVVWVIVVWVVWLLLGWLGWLGWVCMVAVGVCRWCGCI